jgi:hypothetical protein
MAFNSANLIRIGGGSGSALWKYVTTDAQTVVRAAGYFNDAANMLNLHDIICVAADTDGTPVVYYTYVNSNDGSAVDTVDGVAITSTDTD